MVSAILLAAGTSSRMGARNKMLLPYQNKPVVLHVIEALEKAGFTEIIVVTGFEADLFPAGNFGPAVQVVHNPHYSTGMTSSIQQGVRLAAGQGFMICLGDMVTIMPSEYRFLADRFSTLLSEDPRCIALPVYQGQKGNPVIFSAHYRPFILQHTEPEGCRQIVQQNAVHLYPVEMSTRHVLEDMDTPGDYENRLTSLPSAQ